MSASSKTRKLTAYALPADIRADIDLRGCGPLTVISYCGDPGKLDTRDSESSTCAQVNFLLNRSGYLPALAKRLRNFDRAKNDAWPRSIIQVGNNVRLKPTFEVRREPPQLEIKQLLQARQH